MSKNLIKCNSVRYRQGYIEVLSAIHDGCINIETQQVHPDRDLTNIKFDSLTDDEFIAITEVELSVNEAEELVEKLLEAIKIAKEIDI
jgi:hypothetical protein